MLDLHKTSHRRWNPLLREWVLVSPHRTQRPWQGQVEKPAVGQQPKYDPNCYLCPANSRAGGHKNPEYTGTFVFDNDYASLLPDTSKGEFRESSLMIAESERGICRVLCFSPRHDLAISNMALADIESVVHVWSDQYRELGALDWVRYVQIFENRGEMMGASNPHPHCQVWANETIPNYPATEQSAMLEFTKDKGKCMLCEYLRLERTHGIRIVRANDFFTVLVPFWAVWPFEVLVLANEHLTGMDQFSPAVQSALADILKRITSRYDNIFGVSFPYSMGFHQRPTDGEEHAEWHFHAHFYPPLLRSATVRKFMVGYEMLATPQRDITPESAAERLLSSSESPLH
ncbi:MAG TPA: UDP-glucose--hexose-1-phosphate uridylyltransferase [Terriglobales bacterium]|jgi:UDPglucose--hexose-1-phosphate uridylyltransferase|nr:UDP-glucose--hexose-1-phosphate uridylyltransferase [Terriglobales bacterium]